MKYLNFMILLGLFDCRIQMITADLSHLANGEGYYFPYPEQCSKLLNTFAKYASDFTLCSIQNARPVRLCEKCIDQYVNFNKKYKELLDTMVNGTTCGSVYLSKDRLNAVLEYHDSIMAIWNKGNCYSCFNWSVEGPTLTNDTQHFNNIYNATMECIIGNYNLNSSEICEKCMQSYLSLDEFYKSMSSDSIGVDSICMDVVDSMNATRSIWSKTLNCCKLRKTPEIIFLCCTGIISFLPLLFYLSVRYCGPIKDLPNVLKQSRFKQTFLRSRDL